jgi:PEP-CTERM motif
VITPPDRANPCVDCIYTDQAASVRSARDAGQSRSSYLDAGALLFVVARSLLQASAVAVYPLSAARSDSKVPRSAYGPDAARFNPSERSMNIRPPILTLCVAATCLPASASLVYTFDYDALGSYAAASISFASTGFAQSFGDVLTYVSGDINGCAPASIAVNDNGFATPVLVTGSCGDGIGPEVDGLYFQPDLMPPLSLGTFISSDFAGRQFEFAGGSLYRYVGGSLTIRDAGTVPEPTSWALAGIALLMAVATRTRRKVATPKAP